MYKMELLGSKQRYIVELGLKKGFVTTLDVNKAYPKNPRENMNLLVIRDLFLSPVDNGREMVWIINREKFKPKGGKKLKNL